MSIIFNDDLEAYSTNVNPFGAWLDIGFFKGKITANQFNRNHGTRVYQMGLNGQILYQNLGASNLLHSTIYWMGVNTPDVAIAVCSNTSTGVLGQVLGNFHVEADSSVSLYIPSTATGALFQGAALIANSASGVFHQDVWQDYQVAFSVGTAFWTSGTTTSTFVACTATCWVNGAVVCSGQGTTTLVPAALPGGGLTINNYEFSGNGVIDNLWGADTTLTTATFPFDGSNTKARVTQGVIEVIKKPDRAARLTQGTVEVVKRFVPAVRVTQGVIEIIKSNPSLGWRVYEA